jgi:hypothetical protein
MTRRKLSHVIAAGILAALLMLPGPALAEVPHHRGPVDFWSWLAGFWGRGVASLESWSGLGLKVGPGIDPNGGVPPGSGGSTGQSVPTGGAISGATTGGSGPAIGTNG